VAAPSRGVNTLTGEGLAEVLKGASAVVDVSNSPSFEEKAVLEFFQVSTHNLLSYEARAGVRHHVALSVVGTELLQESPYMRAKIVQERLIKESGIPYSIIQATQFFEFVKTIADAATIGNQVHVPPAFVQPIAAEDVASAVAKVAVGAPLNGLLEVERLAYWLWQQRGMPMGSPESDWLLAEELLKRQYRWIELSMQELPLFSVSLSKRTC
jgi:uncharacterized protein YbjT (DUF2867 family)